MAKPRNIHFALSEDNPREAAILAIIERDAQGMTLKEYVCRLVENSGIEERLVRIEALLAGRAGGESVTIRPRTVTGEIPEKIEAHPDAFAPQETAEEVDDLDDDVMDFLSRLNR